MLKITSPQKTGVPQHFIGSFLNFLETHQNFSLPVEVRERAFFVIAANDRDGVYGGAVLYPCPLVSSFDLAANESEEESLNKMFSAFQFQGKEYWRACIGLHIGNITCKASLSRALEVCDFFYQDLYEAFKEFGSQKNIEYLPFTIHMTEVLLTLPHKEWPYFLEVKPGDTPSNYFHGVLSLNGRRFQIRKQKQIVKYLNAFSKAAAILEGENGDGGEDRSQAQSEDLETALLATNQAQNHTDRPVQ